MYLYIETDQEELMDPISGGVWATRTSRNSGYGNGLWTGDDISDSGRKP